MEVSRQNEMLTLYINQMNEIKKRQRSIRTILSGEKSTLFKATNIEFLALQMRMMLELIALGNLIMNKKKYSEIYNRFSKDRNARLILRDIERINPSFYPQPVIEVPSREAPKMTKIIDKKEGYLTKEEFIDLYGELGGILHATNPYQQPKNYEKYEKLILDSDKKIIELLKSHTIKIFEGYFFLIHMHERGKGRACGYIFGEVKDKQ